MSKKIQRSNSLRRLGFWTFAWTLSVALASFGEEFLWEGNQMLNLAAIGLNLFIGILMILANRRLIENLDELEKKIQLESMGLTLGLTLVVGLAYSLLDITNVIPWDAEISFLVIFMGLCYLTTTFLNSRRYR
jgi:hypothetical protein